MDKQEVLNTLEIWHQITRDRVLPIQDVRYNLENGHYEHLQQADDSIGPEKREELDLSALAEGQLLARLKIPAAYFHRCPHLLRAFNFNYWTKTSPFVDQRIVAREIKLADNLEVNPFVRYVVRAIVSRRYNTAFDDIHVIPKFLETLLGDNSGEVFSFYKDTEFTQLFITFRNTRVEREGIVAEAGVTLTNSEVGISCLHIRPLVLWGRRPIYDTSSGKSFYHSGQFNADEIVKACLITKETSQAGVAALLVKSTQTVKDPFKQVQRIANRHEGVFPCRVMEMLKTEWENERNASLLEVARSILIAVKELPIFQKHLATEAVGQYLSLFSDAEVRVRAMLAEDVEEIGKVIE